MASTKNNNRKSEPEVPAIDAMNATDRMFTLIATAATIGALMSLLYGLFPLLVVSARVVIFVVVTPLIAFCVGAEKIMFDKMRKRMNALPKNLTTQQIRKKGPGIFRFFRNKKATVCDIVLIGTIAMFVVLRFILGIRSNWYAVAYSVIFLTFQLHCMWNGGIYNTLIAAEKQLPKDILAQLPYSNTTSQQKTTKTERRER